MKTMCFVQLAMSIALFRMTGCKNKIPEDIQNELNSCVQIKNLSLTQRLKEYPFSKANEIQMISWEMPKIDSLGHIDENGFYISNLKRDISQKAKCQEVVPLNSNQIGQLSKLIHNIGSKNKTYGFKVSDCYDPRNAILFLDENKQLIEYVEICFSCNNFEQSYKTGLGLMCDQKLDLLKNLFIEAGVEYGTKSTKW